VPRIIAPFSFGLTRQARATRSARPPGWVVSPSLLDGGADLLGRPPFRDKLATKDEVALAATLVSNRAELPGLHLLGVLPELADLLVHRSSCVLFCSVLIVPLYIINAVLSSLERNFLQDFLRLQDQLHRKA